MLDFYKKISNFWIESVSLRLDHHTRLLDFHQQQKELMTNFYEASSHAFQRLSAHSIHGNTDSIKAEYRQYIEKMTDLMIQDFEMKTDFAKSHSMNLEKVMQEYKQSFHNLFEHAPLMSLFKEVAEKSKIHDLLKESGKKTAATMVAGMIALTPGSVSSESPLDKQALTTINETLSKKTQQIPIDEQEHQLLIQEILRTLKKLRKKRGPRRQFDGTDDDFDFLEQKIKMLL